MAPPTTARARRKGRPTRDESAALDREVREQALRLFLDLGYDATSMEAIARAAGTTKATLYARFPDKEAVFSDVLQWAIDRDDWPVATGEPPDLDDLEGALEAIARTSLRRVLDPSMVRLSRTAIAQTERFPDLARRMQSFGMSSRHQLVAELLERHAASGSIVADDPAALAELFLGMVASVPARLASFGVVRDAATAEHHLQVALRLFVRGLRP